VVRVLPVREGAVTIKNGPRGTFNGSIQENFGPLLKHAVFVLAVIPGAPDQENTLTVAVAVADQHAEAVCAFLEYLRDEYIPGALRSMRQ